MSGPKITIDLERIERNARTVVETCRKAGIDVFGVTKGTCGMPQVGRAMLRGGVKGLGESRFENIRRLRESGIDCPIMLLRSPPLSHIEEVISSVDISLNSELEIIRELSRVAERMSRRHDIILMVDLGDLREGIWPEDLPSTVEQVLALPNIRIAGLGTNLTCFGAILPTEENMGELLDQARALERQFDLKLSYISGGNSSSLPLLLAGKMPVGINNLRIGEAILQGGRDTFFDKPWGKLDRDAFRLTGELLEVKMKPSMPIGQMGLDAFGNRPVFEDKGDRLRGILNIGREDIVVEGLLPVEEGVEVLGASSDHLVVDLSDMSPPPSVGDQLSFHMNYGALLTAMTSEYVEKVPVRELAAKPEQWRVKILADDALRDFITGLQLKERLAALDYVVDTQPVDPATLSSAVTALASAGDIPLLLGPDHATTFEGLRGLARSTDAFGLLWFDAKASFLPSGIATHGPADTTLFRALGCDEDIPGATPQLSPENVVLIGLRDVVSREAELIRDSRVKVFTIADIDALGIREVMRQALRIALAGTKGLYVSYSPTVTDIPGFDGGSGGITLRETHQAMEITAQMDALLAMDVVNLPSEQTRVRSEAAAFIMSCFGKRIL